MDNLTNTEWAKRLKDFFSISRRDIDALKYK